MYAKLIMIGNNSSFFEGRYPHISYSRLHMLYVGLSHLLREISLIEDLFFTSFSQFKIFILHLEHLSLYSIYFILNAAHFVMGAF